MLKFLSQAYIWNSDGVFFRMEQDPEKYDEKCGQDSSLCAPHSL
jgi:hypothetical protein